MADVEGDLAAASGRVDTLTVDTHVWWLPMGNKAVSTGPASKPSWHTSVAPPKLLATLDASPGNALCTDYAQKSSLHVEVKGVAGSKRQFIITARERRRRPSRSWTGIVMRRPFQPSSARSMIRSGIPRVSLR